MKTEIWFCENCLTVGAVRRGDNEGVWSVSNRIRDHHFKYRNGACTASVRVVCPELIDTDRILCTGRETVPKGS